jgi:hypothetical protein
MSPDNSIDFLRNDVGLWLLFVCGAGLMAVRRKPGSSFHKNGWPRAVRLLIGRMLLGVLLVTPLAGALAIFQRLPPHYFIRLQVADDSLVLGFRWPKPDLVIPLRQVEEIKVTKLRRSKFRIRVNTSTETLSSFGYGRLSDRENQVLQTIRERIAAQHLQGDPPEAASRQ